jgi:succinate dehydrogenase / fumarate reductase cytochrome b subunit
MLVSILHRVTGDGMATVGTLLFVWWLAARLYHREQLAASG